MQSKARYVPAILLATATALWNLPLWAAEAASDGEQLPQLDTTLFPEQLFWLAVNFAILYVLMAFVALPLVRRTQDNRAATIAGDLAAAEAANNAAKNMMAEYEKALADARVKAQAAISENTAQAAKESAAKQAMQQKELAKRLAEAEARIAATRDAAVKEVKNAAGDLAAVIVEKVTAKAESRHVA